VSALVIIDVKCLDWREEGCLSLFDIGDCVPRFFTSILVLFIIHFHVDWRSLSGSFPQSSETQ
jgi:hypothetical protein